MTRLDIKIAVAGLLIIALTAVGLVVGQPRLGNPGLVVEKHVLTNEVGKVVRDERVFLPLAVDEFVGMDTPVTQMEIDTLPDDTLYGRKLYRDPRGLHAQLSAVMMKRDRTSIHNPQVCVTAQGWQIDKTEVISIPIAKPHPYTLKATAMSISNETPDGNGGKQTLKGWYIFWFVSEDEVLARLGEAHWSIARTLLVSGKLQRFAYVSCYSYGRPGEEGVLLARMKRLIASSVPQFQTATPRPEQTASIDAKKQAN